MATTISDAFAVFVIRLGNGEFVVEFVNLHLTRRYVTSEKRALQALNAAIKSKRITHVGVIDDGNDN